MSESELAALKRAVEVGFAKVDGRLGVIDTKLEAIARTTEEHDDELKAARERRWPLPVLSTLGSIGALATAAWAAAGRK